MHRIGQISKHEMSDTESGNSRPDWLKGDPEESTPIAGPANPSVSTALAGTESSSGEHWLLRFQHHAGVLSHILALIAVCVVSLWVSDEAMGGGGVSWADGDAKRVFNWHPVMMVVAFAFMTVSSLSFFMRWRSADRKVNKTLHVVQWTIAAICASIGLVAVFKSHNDAASGFIANLYSLHSWIGIAVILLYVAQFLAGGLSFALNIQRITPSTRAKVMNLHKFFGPTIYIAAAFTILLGIQEKEGFIGCSYKVDQADTFPLKHFSEIPRACKISHSLGIIVFAMALCTTFALYDFSGVPLNRPRARRD